MDIVERMAAERDAARLITDGYAKMLDAADAEIERLRAALTGIKRAGKARMASYGDEHSYYYFTASTAKASGSGGHCAYAGAAIKMLARRARIIGKPHHAGGSLDRLSEALPRPA